MISLQFPKPKDPEDDGWYLMRAPEAVASVTSVVAAETAPEDTDGIGTWSTPGDSVAASPLMISSPQVNSTDVTTADGKTITAGLGIIFKLAGGAPGKAYAVRAKFVTVSGSTLNRSAILVVTGL